MVQTLKNTHKIIVILGATATGKSSFSIALAERINAQIISADSTQIYKNFDIGTAKITPQQAQGIKHHLIDIKAPDQEFSVSEFQELADQKIAELISADKRVIITGGTGFFIKGLLYKQSFGNTAKNTAIRNELNDVANKQGLEVLYEQLQSIDPQSAATIHKNDKMRIIRALEIFRASGKTKSEIIKNDTNEKRYNSVSIGLDLPREQLYQRINNRVDQMLENGLIDEVKGLSRYRNCKSMQAIGYKEILQYLDGDLTLEQTTQKIKQASRNYAKRQITYFKTLPDIIWLDANASFEENFAKIERQIL